MRNSIGRLRMRGESLCYSAGFLFLKVLNFFEEGDEGLRIVSGVVHVLHAEIVRLRFKLAREMEERDRHANRHGFVETVSKPAADEHQWNGAKLRVVRT